MRIALESRIPRHVRTLHGSTVDVLFVYVRVIKPVIALRNVNVVFAMADIMLHYAIKIAKRGVWKRSLHVQRMSLI